MITRALVALVLAVASLQPPPSEAPQHGRLFEPKDLGTLEGPDRDAWQRPDQIMDALGIADGSVVADMGAGGGWFTVRLARRVGPRGRVYAEDIQPQMIESIERRVKREGFGGRVSTVLGSARDPKLPLGVLDAAMFVDAYHEVEHPVPLLRNLARSLKLDGRIGIVDFTSEGGGPGPAMNERVDPQQVIRNAEDAGLRLTSREQLSRYQYMLVFQLAGAAPAPGPPR